MPADKQARLRCPKCNGKGFVYSVFDNGLYKSKGYQTCPRCHGKGWVKMANCEC